MPKFALVYNLVCVMIEHESKNHYFYNLHVYSFDIFSTSLLLFFISMCYFVFETSINTDDMLILQKTPVGGVAVLPITDNTKLHDINDINETTPHDSSAEFNTDNSAGRKVR